MVKDEISSTKLFSPIVIVAALGYFVDIYDLVLFSVVRVPSLKSLGLTGKELTDTGIHLLNMQMIGMLIGGILWGILGDKKGRIWILFGSILLYSLANVANGFVTSTDSYAWWRLIAGIGLAGELGAGITLVSESLPKEKRGLGTMVVATVGLSGALVAGFTAKWFDWRTSYFLGGGLGMALLVLRIGVNESGMFKKALADDGISKGNFLMLFSNSEIFMRYLRCIFVGISTWFVVGILVTLSPEFALNLGITEEITGGTAIMYCYAGLVLGDLSGGLLSQVWRSRKKVLILFLSSGAVISLGYLALGIFGASLHFPWVNSSFIYFICFLLGLTNGYWVIFVTTASEQFGTNLRATVTTSVPNIVRGALVPLNWMFLGLQTNGKLGIFPSAFLVGLVVYALTAWSLWKMKDSFHNDLDFHETI
jgi:MFS transporter, putative metabolite:H+ symporter